MQLYGPDGWKNLRVHHNVFDGNYPWSIKGSSSTHGLIDNNVFKGKAYGIMLYSNGKSDWAAPLTLGTADFFFIEDNSFEFDDFYRATGVPVMDMDAGGRQVFRHNTIRYGMWETHDKARSGLVSANAYELYNNTFTTTSNKWKAFDVSAGTGVIWGNTISGDWSVPIGAIDYKSFDPRSVRKCDGTDRQIRTFLASLAGVVSTRSARWVKVRLHTATRYSSGAIQRMVSLLACSAPMAVTICRLGATTSTTAPPRSRATRRSGIHIHCKAAPRC